MLDETRKRLTEDLLHETWYDPERSYTAGGMFKRSPLRTVELKNRTFRTPQDAQDVKDALVRAGKWGEFYAFAIQKYKIDHIYSAFPDADAKFDDWLHSYTRDEKGQITGYRLCDLAGEFVERGEGG